jgi:hypothetical protein
MRKIFLFISLFLGINNVFAIQSIPKETIFYAAMFDNVCMNKTSYKISPIWVSESKNKLGAWRDSWNQQGQQLLKTTIQLVGIPFKEKNFQVSLSLCSFPSMSAPLIVNARYALASFTKKPISNDVFISTIYHEILHNYIDQFLADSTPLLKKYKSESKGVLNHLHLLALEKAVYIQLGWQSKLKIIIEKDQSLPNHDYKRAWEIVNSEESYLSFIEELKKIHKNSDSDDIEI